ncbi:MAG: FHA domain-containing protein [Planctomycetota bacterium]|nr:MAG: FHA domain-containing protein [Planctomycetota bacterium]
MTTDTRATGRPRFHAVAREAVGLGEEAYLAEHPEPVLVLEPVGKARRGGVTTPVEGHKVREAESTVADVVAAPQTFRLATDVVHPEARVVWLKKSERNPFAGMITLGRAENNDLVLLPSAVSKMHAIFYRLGDSWQVEDRGSTNGTCLDGVRLPPQEKRLLEDGALLRFGEVVSARFFSARSFYAFCRLSVGGEDPESAR